MPKAVGLTEELLNEFKNDINKLELVPGTGGIFVVSLNGEIIFSNKDLGRFPYEGEILSTLKNRNN